MIRYFSFTRGGVFRLTARLGRSLSNVFTLRTYTAPLRLASGPKLLYSTRMHVSYHGTADGRHSMPRTRASSAGRRPQTSLRPQAATRTAPRGRTISAFQAASVARSVEIGAHGVDHDGWQLPAAAHRCISSRTAAAALPASTRGTRRHREHVS